MASISQDNRRQNRFATNDLRVLIARNNGGETSSIEGEIADISPNGVKLRTTAPLQFGEVISLTLKSRTLDVHLKFGAEVRWVKPGTEQWAAGLIVHQTIPAAILQKMALAGFVERRRSRRYRATGKAVMRAQGEATGVTVELVDYSADGVRLRSPIPVEIGERVLLTFGEVQNSIQTMAEARWVDASEDVYCIGFEIPGEQMRSLVASDNLETNHRSLPARGLRNPLILLLGTIAIALVLWNAGWLANGFLFRLLHS